MLRRLSIRRTAEAGPDGVRLRESWLYGICLFLLVAKQSLSENLISTERDLTQRRTIQSQSWSELNWTKSKVNWKVFTCLFDKIWSVNQS